MQLNYKLQEQTAQLGKLKGKTIIFARPTERERLSFRKFCERVAKSTTFNSQEVSAVLNYATEIAKDIVSEGNSVDFGDLGTLTPTFRSVAIEKGIREFNPTTDIAKPRVRLIPSRKYFSLEGKVSYKQYTPPTESKKKAEDLAGGDTNASSGGANPLPKEEDENNESGL